MITFQIPSYLLRVQQDKEHKQSDVHTGCKNNHILATFSHYLNHRFRGETKSELTENVIILQCIVKLLMI